MLRYYSVWIINEFFLWLRCALYTSAATAQNCARSTLEEFALDFIDSNSALKSWLGACSCSSDARALELSIWSVMANPRKFSEKIALHNQKQAEETAKFEQIMREVSDVTAKVCASYIRILPRPEFTSYDVNNTHQLPIHIVYAAHNRR